MLLVPVTDAVADLVSMADTVGVIDAATVLEGNGLLEADGLPVEVFDGFIVADTNELAVPVFDICVE